MTVEELFAARKKAHAYSRELRSDDPRLRHTVIVWHRDGTMLCFRYAFVLRMGHYIAIFTEHHGEHVYHEEDVDCVDQYDPVDIEAFPGHPIT